MSRIERLKEAGGEITTACFMDGKLASSVVNARDGLDVREDRIGLTGKIHPLGALYHMHDHGEWIHKTLLLDYG